jgi:hypothetical protein
MVPRQGMLKIMIYNIKTWFFLSWFDDETAI